MNQKMIKQIMISSLGLFLRGLGVGLMLYAGLGSNAATVFQMGFSLLVKMPYGTGAALINIIIILLIYCYKKKYIHISSFLAIFLIGYSADFLMYVLGYLDINTTFQINLVLSIVGCYLQALGTVIYIQAGLGVGALDVVAEIVSDEFNFDYQVVRMLYDAVLLIIGFARGGIVGLGSILSLVLSGWMMKSILPKTLTLLKPYLT